MFFCVANFSISWHRTLRRTLVLLYFTAAFKLLFCKMEKQKIVKSILNKHKKRDSWFLDDYSVNAYESCACNCLYCYVRGSKYGLDMEKNFIVKTNAIEILEKQLRIRAQKNQYGFVALGTVTDAYVKQEEKYRMTEKFLQLFLKYRFPVFISTKTTVIKRDIELLKEIDKVAILPDDLQGILNRGVIISVSLSSLNEEITNMLEPAAAKPLQRLETMHYLGEHGLLAGVNAIPVLPFISDTNEELEKMIETSKKYNAAFVLTGSLTLFGNEPSDSETLYYRFLERYDRSLIPKYDELYKGNFYPPYYYQNDLKQRADKLCKKYEIRSSII